MVKQEYKIRIGLGVDEPVKSYDAKSRELLIPFLPQFMYE